MLKAAGVNMLHMLSLGLMLDLKVEVEKDNKRDEATAAEWAHFSWWSGRSCQEQEEEEL